MTFSPLFEYQTIIGENGLVDWGVIIRIGRFPVKTPSSAWPSLQGFP